jgi:predicted amidophosphoribosyltransferase
MRELPRIKNVQQRNLSDESCSRCGGDLAKYSLCAVCKQAMEHVCLQCGFRSEGMLHQCHVHLDVYQTRHSMIENTYAIIA